MEYSHFHQKMKESWGTFWYLYDRPNENPQGTVLPEARSFQTHASAVSTLMCRLIERAGGRQVQGQVRGDWGRGGERRCTVWCAGWGGCSERFAAVQTTAGRETTCAKVAPLWSLSSAYNGGHSNQIWNHSSCFQENPLVSLCYSAPGQQDTILPYSCVGSFNRSLPLRPSSSLVLITVGWSQDGSFREASLSSSVLIMARVCRHSLPTPLSHPGMMPSCQIFTFCISFKYTYLLVAFPYLPTPTHTGAFSNHYCRAVCRISMTLLAGHPHPSGFYTSTRGRCDRGLSICEATCWILVQAKRTQSHLSNLETSLYSKKWARPKQTSRSNNTDSSLCPHGDDLRHYC